MKKKTGVKWKPAKNKSWRMQLERESPSHNKVVRIPPRMQPRLGIGTMLIPRPLDVDAIIRSVRKRRLITTSQLRTILARNAKADCACPLTTGIFMRIAAEAAEEDARAGKSRITPYWRVVKDDGSLNEKFPGGWQAQAARLREEGFTIPAAPARRVPRVSDFAAQLIEI